MSGFWVLDKLFKLQAAFIDWGKEAELLGYQGPQQQTGVDAAPVQLRWLLHPALGLPREPFVVWRNRHPGGNPTAQQLTAVPGWKRVETVGLPVDQSWADAHYDLGKQGPAGQPVSPVAAAAQRLARGAPRIGWTRLTVSIPEGPISLPDWEPVNLDAYLRDLLAGPLLHGIHDLLRERLDPRTHAAYAKTQSDDGGGRLNPRLVLDDAATLAGQHRRAQSQWHPLGLLLLSAGADPLASLALGFGTAVQPQQGSEMYMVSVKHPIRIGSSTHEVQLADVVTANSLLRAPDPPSDLSAALIGHTRPQHLDDPALESVGVSWRRALNPVFAQLGEHAPYAISYAIGRITRFHGAILLTRRPERVHGWKPFVASKPAAAEPVLFADHRQRSTNIGTEIVADPLGEQHTYAVAAQDVFGRWSGWTTTSYTDPREPPKGPSVLGVSLQPTGALTVDFGWDWSDRSPEFMELLAAYQDNPATVLLNVRLDFAGAATPASAHNGFDVQPLSQELQPLGSTGWGAAQDRDPSHPDPSHPETRFYRLTANLPFDFAGKSKRAIQVQARGQTHVDHRAIPGFNISPFGPPYPAEAYDPTPPQPPPVPEAPQWATLRDASGISRATLSWTGVPHAVGYVLYEATETTLLAGLPQPSPGPDTTEPFTVRLGRLRNADLRAQRRNFRRLRKELIPATSYEVELPRGSNVLHLYAVTAVSANQVESDWPPNSKQFIAVAAARTRVPPAPSLEATVAAGPAGPVVKLQVTIDTDAAIATVEIHRVADDQLATNVDSMGPPIATLTPADLNYTDPVSHNWQRIWYRAVAWIARDDHTGLVEARSLSSAAVSVLVPPSNDPTITDIHVNEPRSTQTEALVSWAISAPYTVTTLGGHRAVLEAPTLGGLLRLEGRLDTLAKVPTPALVPGPAPVVRSIIRVVDAPGSRLYAWLPRPAADQTFRIELKIIDPLGRIGRAIVDVPPIPPAPPPVVNSVDPENGHSGDQFTITGANLVLRPGDTVSVRFVGPKDPEPGRRSEEHHPCQIVQPTSPTAVTALVPDISSTNDHEDFTVILVRTDGAEVVALDDFFLAIS